MNDEVYVSTDIEADGPIPGEYSMISLASVAQLSDGTEVRSFKVNLDVLPLATQHPDTMAWWEKFPDAYAATRVSPEDPETAMKRYNQWVINLSGFGKPVFVGYPATFDFVFVYWYLIKFVGSSPFGFSALDMKTMAMVLMKSKFRDATKRNMPREWFKGAPPHTHDPLDDAREQGVLFAAMCRQWDGQDAV